MRNNLTYLSFMHGCLFDWVWFLFACFFVEMFILMWSKLELKGGWWSIVMLVNKNWFAIGEEKCMKSRVLVGDLVWSLVYFERIAMQWLLGWYILHFECHVLGVWRVGRGCFHYMLNWRLNWLHLCGFIVDIACLMANQLKRIAMNQISVYVLGVWLYKLVKSKFSWIFFMN